jgi:hypothetical protein
MVWMIKNHLKLNQRNQRSIFLQNIYREADLINFI